MSRLRYPFTEISARCRLCGAVGLTASSEHALGGRLIDWRRAHALVCPEWPRWAATKGLRLDERGALLYPNEAGPYEPKSRSKGEDDDEEDGVVDEEAAPPEPTNGAAATEVAAVLYGAAEPAADAARAIDPQPVVDIRAERAEPLADPARAIEPQPVVDVRAERAEPLADPARAIEPQPVVDVRADLAPGPVANGAPSRGKRPSTRQRQAPPSEPRINLMLVPAENLEQAELF